MSRLPEPAASFLIGEVHDELIFEAPAAQAELVQQQAITTLKQVGTEMMKAFGDIPINVEAVIDDTWRHA